MVPTTVIAVELHVQGFANFIGSRTNIWTRTVSDFFVIGDEANGGLRGLIRFDPSRYTICSGLYFSITSGETHFAGLKNLFNIIWFWFMGSINGMTVSRTIEWSSHPRTEGNVM